MKVLLISPNTLTVPYPVYPIGLDYVAGAIAADHHVRIADLQTLDRDQLSALIAEFAPEVIGISIRNIDNIEGADPRYFLAEYRQLVAWLRQRSAATIVCGGSGFTIMPDRVLALLTADYGIVGEGERLAGLLEALGHGGDPAAVEGVIAAGTASALPPPWPGTQVRRFRPDAAHLRHYLDQGGMLNLQSKRGCSFNCLYCSYPRIEGRGHRLTAPGEVAATARQLQAAGARYLFFTDSAFNSDIDHSLAVAAALSQAGVTIPWGAFFAPIRLPSHYFAALAAAGCRHVEFGTESLAAPMLRAYRKPFEVDDVAAAHRLARQAGLHVCHYLLLGGPGESAATVAESLDGIERLERCIVLIFIGIRIYPDTGLFDLALAEGKIDRDQDLLQPVYYEPDGIDRAAIEALVRKRAATRPNWVIGSGGRAVAATIATMHRRGFTGPLWEYLAR